MTEWVLVLTMFLTSDPGEIRDISPQVVGGFSSKQACEAAASTISKTLVILSGYGRSHQGIASNTFKSAPSVNYECVSIRK